MPGRSPSGEKAWERKGAKDIRERANDKVRKILREHWPTPLSKDIGDRVYEQAKEAQKRLREKLARRERRDWSFLKG